MFKVLAIAIALMAGGLLIFGLVYQPELREPGQLVAYRGGGQLIDYQKLNCTGCTATSIIQSDNIHIENTAQSIANAATAGFDIVHINLHRTQDNQFVLFHDWTLNCATNGSGDVRAHYAAELAELDAGYGYTFDDGQQFPFRAKGYGISSLKSILDKYADTPFWLNLKNNDEASFAALYQMLASEYPDRLSEFVIITSDRGVQWFQRSAPALTAISVESTKECFKRYMLYGWSGLFPKACSNRPILIPPSKTQYLWGYPKKFAALAQANGSRVYLWTQHTPLKNYQLDIANGIGVVTGDSHGVQTLLH